MSVPKEWKDGKAGGTPLSAAALEDAETRVRDDAVAKAAARVAEEQERAEKTEALKAASSEIAPVKTSGANSESDTTVDSSKEVSRKVAVEKARAESAQVVVTMLGADVTLAKESIVFQDVTGLLVPVSASPTEVKRSLFFLEVEASDATEDIEFAFSVPTGCTLKWGVLGGNNSTFPSWGATTTGSTPQSLRDASSLNALSLGTFNGKQGVALIAKIMGGGTAGNVQLRAAQDVGDPGTLKVLKGSWIETLRLVA